MIPFISVIIPTYNSEAFVTGTLETVYSQIYKQFEVIVSDDGSTDRTTDVVEAVFSKYPTILSRLLRGKHAGPGAARNRGIEAASSEWLAFIDSDDLWYEVKLNVVVGYIKQTPAVDLWCHSEISKKNERRIPLRHYKNFNASLDPLLSLYRKNSLSTSAVVVRRKLLLEAGLFDESLPSAQDYDLWLKIACAKAKIGYIKEVLGEYCVRSGNISAHIENRLRCLLVIGERYFNQVKQRSRIPAIDFLKFRSNAFLSAALDSWSSGFKRDGIIFFLKSILHWPFQQRYFQVILQRLVKSYTR